MGRMMVFIGPSPRAAAGETKGGKLNSSQPRGRVARPEGLGSQELGVPIPFVTPRWSSEDPYKVVSESGAITAEHEDEVGLEPSKPGGQV